MRSSKIEQIPISALIVWEKNARTHSKKQIRQIADSMRRFGFTNPVLIDDDNHILAGHGRVAAAKSLGMPEVPCLRIGAMTPAEKRAYVIADNKIALNAGWDEEILAEELKSCWPWTLTSILASPDSQSLRSIASSRVSIRRSPTIPLTTVPRAGPRVAGSETSGNLARIGWSVATRSIPETRRRFDAGRTSADGLHRPALQCARSMACRRCRAPSSTANSSWRPAR